MSFRLIYAAAAEGANLCVYHYDDLKKEKKPAPEISCFTEFADSGDRYFVLLVLSIWFRLCAEQVVDYISVVHFTAVQSPYTRDTYLRNNAYLFISIRWRCRCVHVCSVLAAWNRGKILAEGQNLARSLMEAPANVMTPTRFAEIASEKLGPLDNITVRARYDTG